MKPSRPIPAPGERARADLARAAGVVAAAALAVYAAVWPHELGHALAAFLLGCRTGWWPTGLTPWLAGSRPGDIDPACLAARGRGAVAAVALAGIAVNLAVACLAGAAAALRRPRLGRSLRAFLLLAALANAAEAFSYLVPNAVWPRSDMATAIAAAGVGRLPWLAVGLALAALGVWMLRAPIRETAGALASARLPARLWRWRFVLYALGVGAAAIASRWVFG